MECVEKGGGGCGYVEDEWEAVEVRGQGGGVGSSELPDGGEYGCEECAGCTPVAATLAPWRPLEVTNQK